jgi:hypothetical protein
MRPGDDVLQLYIHDRGTAEKKPAKQLKGFERVNLQPGEIKSISFTLPYDELSFWDASIHSFRVEAGTFDVMVGSSSIDTAVSAQITASAGVIGLNKRMVASSPLISRIARNRFQFLFSDHGPHTVKVFAVNGRELYSFGNSVPGALEWPAPSPGVYVIKLSGPNYVHIATAISSR